MIRSNYYIRNTLKCAGVLSGQNVDMSKGQ